MKLLKTFFVTLSIFSTYTALAATPIETLIPVDHIYTPKGFDSNDNSEVIISGNLPNLCHKSPKTTVEIIDNKINITVKAMKYHETNPFCAEVMLPFIEPVSLGLLNKGAYEIVVNGKTNMETKSEIYVSESTSGAVDNYIYANVEYVEKSEDSRTVKLVGYNPSPCFELDTIEIATNDTDTYAILPKMKQVSGFCPMKMTQFKYDVDVPTVLKHDNVLLHVRAMDGRSINTLFDNSIK